MLGMANISVLLSGYETRYHVRFWILYRDLTQETSSPVLKALQQRDIGITASYPCNIDRGILSEIL